MLGADRCRDPALATGNERRDRHNRIGIGPIFGRPIDPFQHRRIGDDRRPDALPIQGAGGSGVKRFGGGNTGVDGAHPRDRRGLAWSRRVT